MNDQMLPVIKTAIPGPLSQSLVERRQNSVPRGVSYSTGIFAVEGKGAVVKDADGNIFLDFAAGIGVVNTGHADEDITNAAMEQAALFSHVSINILQYEPYIALTEKLNNIAPGNTPKKTMLANSGAEAVENAIKIARKYTGKSGIISLENSFHGRTYMALTLTSKITPYKDGFAPFNSDTYKIPAPYTYRFPTPGLSDDEVAEICAKQFEDMLLSSLSPSAIAAVIIEPVQGEGGFIVLPDHYLRRVREICTKNNILLIADEIQTGIARCGTMYACESAGIEPDIITMSKALAGGFPLSAVIGKAEIMDAPIPGGIGGTFSGNPVSCAAALKVLEKVGKDGLCEKSAELGRYITKRLMEMQKKHLQIGDIRGKGAMIAIELVKDAKTKEPDAATAKNVIAACLQKGVVLFGAGVFGNCVRFLPPLVMTMQQAAFGMDVLDSVFDSIYSQEAAK